MLTKTNPGILISLLLLYSKAPPPKEITELLFFNPLKVIIFLFSKIGFTFIFKDTFIDKFSQILLFYQYQ